MSLLVVVVICLHGTRLGWREIAQILLPAAVFSIGQHRVCPRGRVADRVRATGPWCCSAWPVRPRAALFQAYLMRRRRHQSLALIHEFVEQGAGVQSLEDMAEPAARADAGPAALQRYRARRPATARTSAARPRGSAIRDGGQLEVTDGAPSRPTGCYCGSSRPTSPSCCPARRPTLACATGSPPAARATPSSYRCPGTATSWRSIVSGRLGEATSFTQDDVTLTRTLSGHLAVAMHGVRVVEQLRHDAHHDTLTGLPNRALLGDELNRALQSTSTCAVLLLDLDRFKEVNDALGHHVGDQLLRVVAARLRQAVPAGAVVARLGGDEFAILLPPADDVLASAQAVATEIFRVLAEPVQLTEGLVSTGASLGIAMSGGGHQRVRHAAARGHRDVRREGPRRSGALQRRARQGPLRAAGHAGRPAPGPRARRAGAALPAAARPGRPAPSSPSRLWSAGATRRTAYSARTLSSRSPSPPG